MELQERQPEDDRSTVFLDLIRSISDCHAFSGGGKNFLGRLLTAIRAKGGVLTYFDEDDARSLVLSHVGPPPESGLKRLKLMEKAIESRKVTGEDDLILIPVFCLQKVIGTIELTLAPKEKIQQWQLHLLAQLNDIAAILIRSLLTERQRDTAKATNELKSAAARDITEKLTIVPPQHLLASLQRGFEGWQTHQPVDVNSFFKGSLQTIVDHLRSVIGAEMAALGIGRFQERPFDPWVVSGVPIDYLKKIGRAPRPIGTLGISAIGGSRLRLKDLKKHPAFQGLPEGHPNIKSFMAVPIVYGGICLGTLYLANKLEEEEFSKNDELIAEEFARFAITAVQSTYMYSSLEMQQAHLQGLLDSAPSGVIFIDAKDGRILANASSVELFGIPLSDRKGRDQYVQRLLNKDLSTVSIEDLPSSQALQGKTILGREMHIKKVDGSTLPIRVNAAPVYGLENKITGAVVVFENISSQKELEKFRQDLASMLAHDLRNPLQTLGFSVQILMNRIGQDAPQGHLLELMENNITKLNEMVSELSETSKIESKQIDLVLKSVEVCHYISQVIERLRPAYESRDLRYVCTTPAQIRIDTGRMDRVLANLIENAMKYSSVGAPVEVWVEEKSEGIEINVQDHGKGMDEEQMSHIFERYYRIKGEKTPGLGLGLYIVKALVRAHGGTITVKSALGKGSTFTVTLPKVWKPHI